MMKRKYVPPWKDPNAELQLFVSPSIQARLSGKKPLERSLLATALRRLKKIQLSDKTLAFRKRHGSPYETSGDPDLTLLWRGVHAEIELKRPGENPTLLQACRLGEWQAAGALTFVVHSPQELDAALTKIRAAPNLIRVKTLD